MSNIHICRSKIINKFADFVDCPDCKKTKSGRKSLHLVFCYEWYGPERTCLMCGRKWSDGEWMPLLFCRSARRKNIKNAKRIWRECRE